MDFTNKIGQQVINNKGETGTIIDVGNYIKVKFSDKESLFQLNAFRKGFLKFANESFNDEVKIDIEREQQEESIRVEEQRIAEECAAEERRFAAERAALDDKFGADYHVEHLRKHPILTYKEVEDKFRIRISGFGRGINVTDNAIVLVSSMKRRNGKFVYHDHWTENGDYIYSGEGKNGNQTLTNGNKAIVDASADGKTIYLFVKMSSSEYYFQGRVVLIDYTYENDMDEDENDRQEYKFRLRKIDEA